jgi:LuxR family maltose regulon positive regulatory protein
MPVARVPTAGTVTKRRRFRDLEQRLEGWPAGIVLTFYPLPDEVEQAILKGQGGPEALFNALATPIMKSQPPEIRDFLLTSSTLSRVTPDVCDRALGLPNSAELLDAVQARNLFVSRTASGLVYHTLFRTFLQDQLKATEHNTFVSLHRRAAGYFETIDESDEAFKHYLEAGLPGPAAAVADRAATTYFIEGKVETLLSWAARLAQTAHQSPNLLYRCAIVHGNRFEYGEAEQKLNAAAAVFNARMSTPDLINIALQRATIDLQQGQYQVAMDRATQLLQEETESVIVRLRALNIRGFASLYLGDTQGAVDYLEAARPLYDAHMDAYARSQLLQTLGTAYARLGQLAHAAACLQEVVALRRGLGAQQALAGALNNLDYLYHRESDYPQALATFEEGLGILARLSETRSEAYLLWSLGDLKRDVGSFDEAVKCYYTALERLGDGEPALRCSILRRWEGQG